jgi:hypothetical protein
VQPDVGFPITVTDSLNQWAVIYRTTSADMTGSGSGEFVDQLNNVFAGNDGTVAGATTYRGIILRNNALDQVTSITLSVNPLATATCVLPLPTSGAGTLWGDFEDWPWAGFVKCSSGEIAYYSTRTDEALTVPSIGRGLLGTSAQMGVIGETLNCVPPILLATEAPSSGQIQTIANQTTSPTGLSFSNSVTITSLNPYGEMGLWIKRQLPAGMSAFPEFTVSIALQFTLDGVTYNDLLNGLFRVSDSSLIGYQVWWGIGAPPDLTQPANETFTSFPYTTTTSFTADLPCTLYLSTNARNQWGLVSENTNWTILPITSTGTKNQPPSAPDTTVTATSTGAFEIQGVYYFLKDAVPADAFHLYVSFDNTNPLLQSPITVTPKELGPVDFADYITSAQTIGTTASVILRTYRTSDSQESTNTDIITCTSVTTDFGPAILKGFYRGIAQVED